MAKGKGKPFEREVSELFSLWLTKGQHDDKVRHTGSSGARGTVRKKNQKNADNQIIGDLTATDETLKYFFDFFNVECKTGYYKSKRASKKTNKITITLWSLSDIIDGSEETPTFFEFWDQACTDAFKSKREPLLVFRRNRRKICIAMFCDVATKLHKWNNFAFGSINRLDIRYVGYAPITVISLNDFMAQLDNGISSKFIETHLKPLKEIR